MIEQIYAEILRFQKPDTVNARPQSVCSRAKPIVGSGSGVLCGISFFCLLAVMLFVAGCNTISRCDPCMPVDVDTEQSVSVGRYNLSSDIHGKKPHRPDAALTFPPSQKQNSPKNKPNPMSYLTIPPPPESPE
ncbi:MAG: hypothetical protein LBJ00_00860 [Planctomycetaceae bacterium]|jgi:hypothetical protein|nr:hypothetical protein [Planctomycetaceae bacterium]